MKAPCQSGNFAERSGFELVARTARSAVSQAAGLRRVPPTRQSATQQTGGLRYET